MHIYRDGGRHLYAALGGQHTGHPACQAGRAIGGHGAVFAGQAVYMACRIAQRGSVAPVQVLRRAVLVHGRAGRCISGIPLAGKQAAEVLDGDVRRSGGADHRSRVRALGAGVDILAYPADGLSRHIHALRFHAAVQLRHGGVIQNGKTHCRACACPAAHCLRVGDELAHGLGIRGNGHIAGQLGHGVIQLAHDRPGVHGA